MSEERIVKVSGQCELSDEEIRVALTRLNEAKGYQDSEVVFSFTGGHMVQSGNIVIRSAPGEAPPAATIQLGGERLPRAW